MAIFGYFDLMKTNKIIINMTYRLPYRPYSVEVSVTHIYMFTANVEYFVYNFPTVLKQSINVPQLGKTLLCV